MDKIKSLIRCSGRTINQFINMSLSMSGKKNKEAHYLAIMIKHIHAVEKGLAMQEIRPGFGLSRIHNILDCLERYLKCSGDVKKIECSMAYSVIMSYINYHKVIEYSDQEYEKMKQRALHIFRSIEDNLRTDAGGVIHIYPKDMKIDIDALEKCVTTRHSIRDFSNEPVSDELLQRAIHIAMHAPSACNRQATRVYILDRSKFHTISGWTGGVKTFLDSVDKILIITGQMSAYEKDEFWQYTVSASIFAGYLSLSLHAVGLGSCLLQRSLVSDKQWKKVAKEHHIPEDEQVVCAMAVGVPSDTVKVPVSQRLGYDRVVKHL